MSATSPLLAQRPSVARQLTAISRNRLSAGARTALEDGLLQGSVLDYGCGRGGDVAALTASGVDADGWDPHWRPEAPRRESDVVLLTYVLNTIEDADERMQTLEAAWMLARKVLVVTARLTWERGRVTGEDYSDGVITSRSTFQHLYGVKELAALVGRVSGQRTVLARPGVVYVFRADGDRFRHLAARYGLAGPDGSSLDLAGAQDVYERRGRLPAVCDGVPAGQLRAVQAAVRRTADPERAQHGAKRSIEDLLLFLALERFYGRPRYAELPPAMREDVRAHLGTYRHACWRADRLLRQLRDSVLLRRTMRSSVGKLTPSALYVHHKALASAPVLLRLYEECGAVAGGRPDQWDVVKLHHDRPMISWLSYPAFDRDPHPRLHRSYRVDLVSFDVAQSTYEQSENPPLLHRKHEFLAADDARSPLYRRLTEQEVRAGLYQYPERIGTSAGWEAELRRCGRDLRGHRLVKRPGPLQ